MARELINIEMIDQASNALRRLAAAGGRLRPLFVEIGEYLDLATRERFDAAEAPDGTPWAPLSPRYQARKKRRRDQILVLDSFLRDQMSYAATDEQLEFGTNRIYGPTHQFGDDSRNIPARPFLGLSTDDQAEIVALAGEHLREALG